MSFPNIGKPEIVLALGISVTTNYFLTMVEMDDHKNKDKYLKDDFGINFNACFLKNAIVGLTTTTTILTVGCLYYKALSKFL